MAARVLRSNTEYSRRARARLVIALCVFAGWLLDFSLCRAAEPRAAETMPPPEPPASPRPRLSPPRLRAKAIGPTMVALEAESTPGERVFQVAVVGESVGPESNSGSRRVFLSGRSYQGTHWEGVDGVAPSGTYRYKARAESGSSRDADSAWSETVEVTTSAAPADAPAAPTALTATPDGPFRIVLKWQNRSQNEYGFEVQKRTPHGDVRVGLANPHDSSFVVHGRPPQSRTTYRVRAFNPRGVSLPSNDATATTPSVTKQGESTEEIVEPCTTRAEVMESILSEDPEGSDRQPRVEKLGGPLDLELLADPALCGNANCSWEVYGVYRGCYRRLGDAFGVGHKLLNPVSDAPLLLVIGHMSASDSSAAILEFMHGKFEGVDSYGHCEGPGENLLALSPPFDSCQEDDDLWWAPEDRPARER